MTQLGEIIFLDFNSLFSWLAAADLRLAAFAVQPVHPAKIRHRQESCTP